MAYLGVNIEILLKSKSSRPNKRLKSGARFRALLWGCFVFGVVALFCDGQWNERCVEEEVENIIWGRGSISRVELFFATVLPS